MQTTPQHAPPAGLPAPADAALVVAAREGDREAYGLLVRRHRPMVVALSRRILDDPALAEDAVSEAVVAGLSDLDRLRDPERFGPWLAGIALNVCRRWLRERARYTVMPSGRGPLASTSEGPESAAELGELAARVRRAVAALPPGQREAVAGFYLQGLGHRELAAELGIGVGAVKTRLHKARVALRRRLHDLHPQNLHDEREERLMTAVPDPGGPVPMRVVDVHRLPPNADGVEPHVVVLDEVDGDRRLPIWIGPTEAAALAFTLAAVELPRPPTYRFAGGLVAAAGGTVRRARITRLTEGVFFAEVLVEGAAGVVVAVDARPSDALNLALVLGAPIDVDAAVLAEVARGDRGHELPAGLLAGDGGASGADAIVTRWLAHSPVPARRGGTGED